MLVAPTAASAFARILCTYQNELTTFVPANHLDLERLEQMLGYLNTHFESIVSLQEVADQVHLSREVCCRLFKKMTVFSNASRFARAFRKQFGCNPGEYNSLKQHIV